MVPTPHYYFLNYVNTSHYSGEVERVHENETSHEYASATAGFTDTKAVLYADKYGEQRVGWKN